MLDMGRICSRDVDLADPDESVQEAARRMDARSVGTLVILDAQRRPTGIISDRDLVVRVLAEGKDPVATKVRDILSAPVETIGEAATADIAIGKMRARRCRRLPVVNGKGELVGIVTLDDVLTVLAEQLRGVAGLLESQAPHRLDEGEPWR